ncbi:hypothetical protein LTR84_012002 [Exophiala bonariae]|uniref:Uncharacterized protein n=1 Tax=Exophiala bonariae TaxID=1690606 RepID=A0AAV9MRB8_9EURO|nr:hypothetical protein LTR84_012002 [Exophiala bonariae]
MEQQIGQVATAVLQFQAGGGSLALELAGGETSEDTIQVTGPSYEYPNYYTVIEGDGFFEKVREKYPAQFNETPEYVTQVGEGPFLGLNLRMGGVSVGEFSAELDTESEAR